MIIFNKSLEDHLQTLDKLLTKIDELNLKLNRSKGLFDKNEIKFFGVIISKDGVKADPSKIVKELRSFLGLCTYVSKFIVHFSDKTKHFRELLQKNKRFIWTENHQKEFENMK